MEIESESENNTDERGNGPSTKKHASSFQIKMEIESESENNSDEKGNGPSAKKHANALKQVSRQQAAA